MKMEMKPEGLGQAPAPRSEGKVNEKNAPGSEMLSSPKLREPYNKVWGSTMKMLYSEKFMPKAEEIVKNAPTPEAGIAQIAAVIGARIYKAAQQAGEDIPDEVMLLGGWQVVKEIADFARTDVGLEVSDDQVESALYLASDELRTMLGGNHNIGSSMNDESRQKIMEMSGGEEGAAARKQRVAAALLGKKGQRA